MNYTDENRGLIQYRERAKQLTQWGGIQLPKNITPSDIDGFIEYHNKIFIFYEVKGEGVDMPRGQEVALKRTVDALNKAGKFSVLFVCEHNVSNPENDIDGADTIVRNIYVGGEGPYPGNGKTAKEATDIWVEYAKKRMEVLSEG